MSRPSTLIFAHGALGDSVLLWPLLRAVAPATLIAPREKAHLAARWLAGISALDLDAPGWARLHAPDGAAAVDEQVRALLGGAGRIIDFVGRGDDAWSSNLRRLAPEAAVHPVRARPEPSRCIPVVEHHAEQLARRGWPVEPIPAEPRANPTGPVVLHPGSGGRAKCWPPQRWQRLAERVGASGRAVVLTIGEVERERLDAEWLEHWSGRWRLVEPTDAVELSERLAGAAAVVAADSGPAHLAGQLGVPTLALFGPTDPRVWAPWGPAVTVLRPVEPRPMDWLGVEPVAGTLEAMLGGVAPKQRA